ncbi:MAG: hypothetical protein V4469_03595 [Patescibacteria group bacterium]
MNAINWIGSLAWWERGLIILIGILLIIVVESCDPLSDSIRSFYKEARRKSRFKKTCRSLPDISPCRRFEPEDLILVVQRTETGPDYGDNHKIRFAIYHYLNNLDDIGSYKEVVVALHRHAPINATRRRLEYTGSAARSGCCGGSWIIIPGLLSLLAKIEYMDEIDYIFSLLLMHERFGNYIARWFIPDHGTPQQLEVLLKKGEPRDVLYFLSALVNNEGRSRHLFEQLEPEIKERWSNWQFEADRISAQLPDWRIDPYQ